MARISDPIPVEDATRIERHPDGSRTPSDVLQAMASGNSATTWGELIEDVNGLYRCGYAVVKVLPDEPDFTSAEWTDTGTGWRETTIGRKKWATAYAVGEGPGACPVCSTTDPHAHPLATPGGAVEASTVTLLPEATDFDRFLDAWRHHGGWRATPGDVEMLLAEIARLKAAR